MILCRKQYAAGIDRQVFPGLQGGPLMHVIAAKAVCLREAMQPEFKEYQEQVVRNAVVMAEELAGAGLRIVSGGTDNHLLLADVTTLGTTGRDAALALESVGIAVNRNSIPFDPSPPAVGSGIRIGTPSVTTRGMKEPEVRRIAGLIAETLRAGDDGSRLDAVREAVEQLCTAFPKPD
jgi:glycine hydroxymethyltransferase